MPSGGGFGTQEPARWQGFVDWMKEQGMIRQDFVAADAFDAGVVGK